MEPGAFQAFVAFFLGLSVTAGILVPVLLRLRAAVGEARAERSRLKDAHVALGEDLSFLTRFLKDYPRLTRELYGGLTERQIPGVLLAIIQRSLDAQQVAVLVKRSHDKGGEGRAPRLVVAAAYPEGAAVKVGMEVPLDAGEVGFAAESQIVVNRQDLQTETAVSRIKPGPGLPGMPQPDLIAPLVFDQDTLGVIVVAQARRAGDPKAALRLVAQTGAQVLHTAAQLNRMKTTAQMDGLTRIYNKEYMQQALSELVYRAACAAYDQRAAGPSQPTGSISVFLFDIDNFKSYNDTNGHLAGDKLLRELAALVSEHVRKDNIFGRFGGEEFLLVLSGTNATRAMVAAEKIRDLLANHPFPFADSQPLGRISVSGGVAEYPTHGLDAPGLLRAADEALYEAKRTGRNRVLQARTLTSPAAPVADGEMRVLKAGEEDAGQP